MASAAIVPALPGWHAAAVAEASRADGGTRVDGGTPVGAGAAAPPDAALAAARAGMAWGALASGIALAHAGLGAVHGIAAALGAAFPVHHGTACGMLLSATTRANIEALTRQAPHAPALARYADAGRLVAGDPGLADGPARAALVAWLADLTAALGLPRLRDAGVGEGDIAGLVAELRGSSMRTNPIVLSDDEIAGILRASR